MNKLQQLIYNEGERLIPYISHDEAELIRHRSSYVFFHNIITSDLEINGIKEMLSIVDLGFGCGYGCSILANLPNSQITGVDISPECEIFANQYYSCKNVNYVIDDLANFIPSMTSYDYVVSRGVLEHISEGLSYISKIKFNRRVMIDVPYNELPGNEHHVLVGITEKCFAEFENCEIFYEDLEGCIYSANQKPQKPNMIMIVISDPSLPKVASILNFPIPAVYDKQLEILGNKQLREHYYQTPIKLLTSIEKLIRETDVVLDIGCGIKPMNYFNPKLHIMADPCKEYINILTFQHAGDKSKLILLQNALSILKEMADNSIDSIFLLDVIEHIDKEEGFKIIAECERVAREQIIIFTPLGFMPQHIDKDGIDAWGLNGGTFQQHISGWTPADFDSAWSMHICKEFHHADANGNALPTPFGAFFAIRNFEQKSIIKPKKISDLRIPFFSAYETHKYYHENLSLRTHHQSLQAEIQQLQFNICQLRLRGNEYEKLAQNLQTAYTDLLNTRSLRLIRFIKKCLGLQRRNQEMAL